MKTRGLVRATLVGFIVLAIAVWVWTQVGPSPIKGVRASGATATTGPCKSTGVTEVIDYGHHGKPTGVFCVQSSASASMLSGWDVLTATGLAVAGTGDNPDSFVCRIDGIPSASKESCATTPTLAEGTWSYFTAALGSSKWSYSNVGAATSKPVCGSWQGWRFNTGGATTAPALAPKPLVCG